MVGGRGEGWGPTSPPCLGLQYRQTTRRLCHLTHRLRGIANISFYEVCVYLNTPLHPSALDPSLFLLPPQATHLFIINLQFSLPFRHVFSLHPCEPHSPPSRQARGKNTPRHLIWVPLQCSSFSVTERERFLVPFPLRNPFLPKDKNGVVLSAVQFVCLDKIKRIKR